MGKPLAHPRPGRRAGIVVAGDVDAPAVAEVVEVVEKPTGQVVHLRLLPGVIEDYQALVRRAITPA